MNKELNKRKTNAIEQTVAAIIFYILVILLLPVMIIGYVIWIGKSLLIRDQKGFNSLPRQDYGRSANHRWKSPCAYLCDS